MRAGDMENSAYPPTRKPAHRRWAALAIILLTLGAAAGGAAIFAGRFQDAGGKAEIALQKVLREAGFSVRSISVAGRVQTGPAELLRVLNIARNDSILHIDLDAVHDRIASLPWVKDVRVTRNLPDAIHIELFERHPIAIWQRNGKMVLVDDEGVEITEKDVAEYHDLPLIVGKGAPQAASELISLLGAEPQLGSRVAAAVRVGERRWNMRLKDGIDVRLPEKDPLTAWHRLARYEENNGLLGRDVELVDLRLANRVVVRLSEGAVRRAKGPEREAGLHSFALIRGDA
ncbi:MAG: FtsQ-type POTRA domain-containing protein [Alphaproteobacteria bacterium]|nr:FtsQ-type POTRA domain-containing protein [Alphaproteobacteria bacterium]